MTDLNLLESTGYAPSIYGTFSPFFHSYYYWWNSYYYYHYDYWYFNHTYYGNLYVDPHIRVSDSGKVAANGLGSTGEWRAFTKTTNGAWTMLAPQSELTYMTDMSEEGTIAGLSHSDPPCDPAGWHWWWWDSDPEGPEPWEYGLATVWNPDTGQPSTLPPNILDCTDCEWWSAACEDYFDETCAPFSFPFSARAVNGAGTTVGTMWSWWWGVWGWGGYWGYGFPWWYQDSPVECCENWFVGAYVKESDGEYQPIFEDWCKNSHVVPVDINNQGYVLAVGISSPECVVPEGSFLWKGTVKRVLPNNIQALAMTDGDDPIIIGIGVGPLAGRGPVIWDRWKGTRVIADLVCGDYQILHIRDINNREQMAGTALIEGRPHAVLLTLTDDADPPDEDDDGWPDECDNCSPDEPLHHCQGDECANEDQADADGDGVGDVCDNCPNDSNGAEDEDPQQDTDGDKVGNICDNCPDTANSLTDYVPGDSDDECALELELLDTDDRWQPDWDCDGVGDACDNCLYVPNARQIYLPGDSLAECAVQQHLVSEDGLWQPDFDCDGVGDACPGSVAGLEPPNKSCPDGQPRDPKTGCCPETKNSNETANIDPVYLFSGEYYLTETDLELPGRGFDFVWSRKYRSRLGQPTAMGVNWDYSYNIWVAPETGGTGMLVHDGNSRTDTYSRESPGRWTMTGFFRILTRATDGTYTLEFEDKGKWQFNSAGQLTSSVDRNGNTMRFDHDGQGRLWRITDTLGREITIEYDDGYIHVVRALGRSVVYTHDAAGDLRAVRSPIVTGTPNNNDFPNGKTVRYTYSSGFENPDLNHNLLTVEDAEGQVYLRNYYSAAPDPSMFLFDRIERQEWGGTGHNIYLTYVGLTPTPADPSVIKVIVNDRLGHVSEYFFDDHNRGVKERVYTGLASTTHRTTENRNRPRNKLRSSDPEFFETRYQYNDDGLLYRTVHPRRNVTLNVYQSTGSPQQRGNVIETHRLPDESTPLYSQADHYEVFTYEDSGCCWNAVHTHRDENDHVTTYDHDAQGNLETVTYANGVQERFGYNDYGQLTSHTWPRNDVQGGYQQVDEYVYYTTGVRKGYLWKVIADKGAGGLNLTTEYDYDAAGNVTQVIAPNGLTVDYVVNELDQVVRKTVNNVLQGDGSRADYRTEYWFDRNNNLAKRVVRNMDDPDDTVTVEYGYEMLNHLLSITTRDVNTAGDVIVEYAYDRNRNRTLVRSGEATAGFQARNEVATSYDERDLPFEITPAPGESRGPRTQYRYDANGNPAAVYVFPRPNTLPPQVTSYSYDRYDRLSTVTDAMGNVTTLGFDKVGNLTSRTVHGELNDETGSDDNVLLSSVVNDYDELDRLLESRVQHFRLAGSQPPVGDGVSRSAYTYTDRSSVKTVTDDRGHVTTWTYDNLNRPWTVTDAKGNWARYEYNEISKVRSVVESAKSDLGGAEDKQYETSRTYDELGRLLSETDETDGIDYTSGWGYDSRGNLLTVVDRKGNTTRHAYDRLDRLTRTERDLRDAGGQVVDTITTAQGWDKASRLVRRTDDNNHSTTYTYDAFDRVVTVRFADATTNSFTYDRFGNMETSTDANGTVMTQTHDRLGRLMSRVAERPSGSTVSDSVTAEQFAYDGLSRMVQAADDDSRVDRAFDSMGNLVEDRLIVHPGTAGQVVGSTGASFDGLGFMVAVHYPGGRYLAMEPDALGRLKRVWDPVNPSVDIARYDFVGPGRTRRRTYASGLVSNYSYTSARQTASTTFGPAGGPMLDSRWYAWDREGNKTGYVRVVPAPAFSRQFEYDSAYRMVRSRVGTDVQEFALDGVGNRHFVSGPGGGSYTLSDRSPLLDAQMNQYTATPFGIRRYDGNGNLTEQGQAGRHDLTADGLVNEDDTAMFRVCMTGPEVAISDPDCTRMDFDLDGDVDVADFADLQTSLIGGDLASRNPARRYDCHDQMDSYTDAATGRRTAYLYDALGRRIGRILDADGASPQVTCYFHFGDQVFEEQDGLGATTATYVYGRYIDEVLTMRRDVDANGTPEDYFFHGDDLYNVTVVTDAAGQVVERYEYGDFGQPIVYAPDAVTVRVASSIGNTRLWNGRDYDAETGLYYYRTRYLDPRAGRFTSRDTIGIWGDPGNLGNGYTYVGNNPWTHLDPYGLWWGSYWNDPVTETLANLWGGFERTTPRPPVETDDCSDETGRILRGYRPTGLGTPEGARQTEADFQVVQEFVNAEGKAALTAADAAMTGLDVTTLGGTAVGHLAIKKLGKKAVKEVADNPGMVNRLGRWVRGLFKRCPEPRPRCFVAGTAIVTPHSTKAIEEIKPGDRVLAYDQFQQSWLEAEVTATFAHPYDGVLVTLCVGAAELTATGDHPVWVVSGTDLDLRPPAKHLAAAEQLATQAGRWVDACFILAGDFVLTQTDGPQPVTTTHLAYGQTTVYNIEVNAVGTFAVGPSGILVHNKPVQVKEIPCAPKRPGSKGAADHQAKVEELGTKAERELKPGEQVAREKRIRGHESERIPDQQILDPSGKTRKVFEAERHPNRKYHQDRLEEYKRLGVEVETHPLKPGSVVGSSGGQ